LRALTLAEPLGGVLCGRQLWGQRQGVA
jgi:hypothetical protein